MGKETKRQNKKNKIRSEINQIKTRKRERGSQELKYIISKLMVFIFGAC